MIPSKDYLIGSVYLIEPIYSDAIIRRDLTNMRDTGFNLITLWPVANPWLSETATEYRFERTRFVLDVCNELGMKAILQLFGQNHAQEFAPDATLTRDMMVRCEEGDAFNHNGIWVNLNHPSVREALDRYLGEAIAALKDHPAVHAWDVFNETHFRSDDPWTIRLYQQWLEKKYADIKTLNITWHRRYEYFSQIDPTFRASCFSEWSSLLPVLEYNQFRADNLTEICRFLYETTRKHDPTHPVMIDGTAGTILYDDVTIRNSDEYRIAQIPDIYGATFYPKSWGRNYNDRLWMASLYYSIPAAAARKAGRPHVVNELQTHTQSALTPGTEVTPTELSFWCLMCIFTGAASLQLWKWRPFLHGRQATGRGLTRIDGTPNERGRAMKQLVGTLHSVPGAFAEARPPVPAVRIGVSYRGRLFYDILSQFSKNVWPLAVEGWYRAFWRMGATIEMADLDQLGDVEMKSPIFVLPSAVSISPATAKWLRAYTENGGILIADARLGTVDEWGVVPMEGLPGHVLGEVFGVMETDVGDESRFTFEGETIRAAYMHQVLETRASTEVLGRMDDGSPAVVSNRFGKGRAIYFNSFLGVELSEGVPPVLEAFFRQLLVERCPKTIHAEKSDTCHLALLESGDTRSLLIVNNAGDEENVRLFNLPTGIPLRGLASGQTWTGEPELTLAIPAKSWDILTWVTSGK